MSPNAVGIQIAVNDFRKVPPKAEQFAETLVAAGPEVKGGKFNMGGSDFRLVIGSKP